MIDEAKKKQSPALRRSVIQRELDALTAATTKRPGDKLDGAIKALEWVLAGDSSEALTVNILIEGMG